MLPREQLPAPSNDEAIEEETIEKKLDGFFKPLIKEGAIIMMKSLCYAFLGLTMSLAYSVAQAESDEPIQTVEVVMTETVEAGEVIVVPVEQEKSWWQVAKEKTQSVWATSSEKAEELSTGLLNPDRQNQKLLEKIRQLNERNAELEKREAMARFQVMADTAYYESCLQDVSSFINDLHKQATELE